jgi:hypothetical protein
MIHVDDEAHGLHLSHSPVAVAATSDGQHVEIWCESTRGASTGLRWFRVFGMGHPLPDDARWVGTCPRTSSGLVWHLYEVGGP